MKALPERTPAEMLAALLACERLNEFQRTGFIDIHAKMQRCSSGLTQNQIDWIRAAFTKYDLEAEMPAMNLVSSGHVPRGHDVALPEVLRHLPKRPPGR